MLEKYISAYINHLKSSGHSPETISLYRTTLSAMGRGIESVHPLADLSGIKGYMIESFVHGMTGVAASSTNLYITIIKLFFTYLNEAGYIDANPSVVLRKTKIVTNDDPFEENNDQKAYNDKQILRLMRSITGRFAERDKAIVAMLSGSGLRASEICSLTLGQWTNMQNGHIYVKRKGGAMRWVAVASYVASYVEEYLATRKCLDCSSPLFATKSGGFITRQDLYKILGKRQEDAGLQKGVHIFRHTFLTGTSKTSNEKIAQSLANHSSSATTKRYIHSTAEERMAAVNGTAWAEEMEKIG